MRWVRGFDFGVEFVNLAPDETQEVQGLVQELQQAPVDPPAPPRAGKP